MAADGVSIQTNLAQLGNLAKAQARSQASAQGVGVAQDLKQEDLASVNKVAETEKTDQNGVDPDQERERRRQKRNDEDNEDNEDENEQPAGLGGLVDFKA